MFINIINNYKLEIKESDLGILISGGADSALLFYFLLKYSKNKIHIFSLANAEKGYANIYSAINVIAKCAELTNNYNFTHHISYDTHQDKINLFLLTEEFLKKNIINYVYTGITKNPPNEVTNKFVDETTETLFRDPNIVRPYIQGNYITPWTNFDKKEICDIYQKYNLLDTLFPLTRSCEWVSKKQHGKNPKTKHCGRCWWCQEREWGFGRLN